MKYICKDYNEDIFAFIKKLVAHNATMKELKESTEIKCP